MSFGRQLSKQLLYRMSLITRNAKAFRSMTVQYMSQNLPKRSLRDFPFYVNLTTFYLQGAINNVIITQRFHASSVQANGNFFWHTDNIFQLYVVSFTYALATARRGNNTTSVVTSLVESIPTAHRRREAFLCNLFKHVCSWHEDDITRPLFKLSLALQLACK